MGTTNRSLASLCASDIMSRNILMIRREMSLQGAARLLNRAGVTGAPVVDDQCRCVGVLSATDFMHSVETGETNLESIGSADSRAHCAWQIPEDNMNSHHCVADFMTKDPVLIGPATPIADLARTMVDAHIHRVIVVDMACQRPLGVVSTMDILAVVARLGQSSKDNEGSQGYAVPVGVHHGKQIVDDDIFARPANRSSAAPICAST
jgi:predicted transcriptional regulator